jgi:rare lipoprotein A
VAKKAILLAGSCAALLAGALGSGAAPFGELYYPREARTFASPMLDPTIAKWLMTLPQEAASPQRAAADPALAADALAGDMFAGAPVGGEAHELVPAEPPASGPSAAPPAAERVVTAQMLDPAPIGGEVYPLTAPPRPDATASISTPDPIKPEPLAAAAAASLAKPETGIAVWYRLPGRTASGEVANPQALTAGHRTLPLGSRVRVVNRLSGASVVVRINDRGPRQKKFVIDMSQASARAIGLTGTAPVTLKVEQWGAIAANSPRIPALEGRSAVKHRAKIRASAKVHKQSVP